MIDGGDKKSMKAAAAMGGSAVIVEGTNLR